MSSSLQSMSSSMTSAVQAVQASEYLQRIPVQHLFQQQKVNAELWHWWNLVDHERAIAGPYEFEKSITSPAAAGAPNPDGLPPALPLGYSICSRRWGQEQKACMDVHIGAIIFAKDGTGRWDTSGICTTYALERVDEPRRWNKYSVRHLASERFDYVIRAHNAAVAFAAPIAEPVEYSNDEEEKEE